MWDLKVIDTSKSLYVALADALERDILNGILQPGDALPSHRELAKKVGVTVTTITRAYAEAERRNLIKPVVGKGTFVSGDAGAGSSFVNAAAVTMPLVDMGLVHPLYSTEGYFEEVLRSVLEKGNLNRFIPYAYPQGHLEHRKKGAEWVARFGIKVSPDRIVVASGTQHAMHCIFSTLFEPGDRVAVDSLTYPGVKSAARSNGLRLEAIGMDAQGMEPEQLDSMCNHQKIKGVYLSGAIQNPTNRIMTLERRTILAEVIEKHGILLVEDDVYGFLSRESKHTVSALLPERSIYIAGLSKAFYTGLRVAFVAAPENLCIAIAQGVVDSVWMTPPLCVEIVCEAITSGVADKIIWKKKKELDRRIAFFKKAMIGYSFTLEERSMHVWLRLPDGWTSAGFEQSAQKNGLKVYSSEKFTVGHIAPPNFVRLAISAPDNMAAFRDGVMLLKKILEREPIYLDMDR